MIIQKVRVLITLQPLLANEITIVSYPTTHAMQSHGIAFDYAIDTMKLVETPYFITLESDSFPVQDGFLDIYRHAYASGFDMIGSQLQLSGGNFIHPTGAMYTTKLYNEAAHYVKHNLPYMYIPNAAMKDGFPCHLMVKEEIFLTFLSHPRNYIEPNPALEPYVSTQLRHEQRRYLPVASGLFHQGMGYNLDSFGTYGHRNMMMAKVDFTKTEDQIVWRMGSEPGQWLCYYAVAHNKEDRGQFLPKSSMDA